MNCANDTRELKKGGKVNKKKYALKQKQTDYVILKHVNPPSSKKACSYLYILDDLTVSKSL